MRYFREFLKNIKHSSIMSEASRIILTLLSTVILAASSIGEENTTNLYFEQCENSHKNTRCADTAAGSGMRRCKDEDDVHFYCKSTSPIQVTIGSVNSKKQSDPTKSISITSSASSKNGNYSYCIDIASRASLDYSVLCRTSQTNVSEAKWIPFNDNNWRFRSYPLTYINVTMADSKTFCHCSIELYLGPVLVLLPCDTWHMCAVELANWQKYNKNSVTTKLVDSSTIVNETPSSCPNVDVLFSLLEKRFKEKNNKPGLLTFECKRHNRFLLPYNPSNQPSQENSFAETLVAFELKSNRSREIVVIECQSSVVHSCGLQLVTNNLRIKNSTENCHRHFMTVELIPGLNGTITCSAFNEFKRTWDSKTECFPSDYTNTLNVTCRVDTPNHRGNNTNTSNEDKPTESPHNAVETMTPTLENTDTTPPVDARKDPERTSLVLIIVGAVLGGIFLSLLILLPLLIYFYKKTNLQRQRIQLKEEEICEFMDGIQMEKAKSRGIDNVFVLPYDRSLEVSKISVDFKTTILGSGAFGQVLKGRYQGHDVAIKTIDGTKLNVNAFRCLLSELKIMSYLGKHEHVMELAGAITSNIKRGEVYLILEYCAHGNVLSYIREHREGFINFLSDDKTAYVQTTCITTSDPGSELSSQHLVRWSYEVACGMEYVSSRNIYHGDLAARNILLTENLTVKVGDFGLSRQLDMETYACYVQKKECPLPLKWMAIESLRDLKFSIQTDVWSFGVTLWEFFSLGTIPYPGMEWNLESWKSLCEGVRLDRPEFASMRIYENIMRKCWNEDPKDRPTFSRLKSLFKGELEGFNSVKTCKVATLRGKYEKISSV